MAEKKVDPTGVPVTSWTLLVPSTSLARTKLVPISPRETFFFDNLLENEFIVKVEKSENSDFPWAKEIAHTAMSHKHDTQVSFPKYMFEEES